MIENENLELNETNSEEKKNNNVEDFCNSLVYATSQFNNLREYSKGEAKYFTTFALFKKVILNEFEEPTICYEFGIDGVNTLEKTYKRLSKRKDYELIKFVAFYKSNNQENCKKVMNYFTLLYLLNSEIKVLNEKVITTNLKIKREME